MVDTAKFCIQQQISNKTTEDKTVFFCEASTTIIITMQVSKFLSLVGLAVLLVVVGLVSANKEEPLCDCSATFDPVCVDGITYPNACLSRCLLKTRNVQFTAGECKRFRSIVFKNVCQNPKVKGPRFCKSGYLLTLEKKKGKKKGSFRLATNCSKITHFEQDQKAHALHQIKRK